MRVHVVDPSAYTPPYDHALCTRARAQPGRRSSSTRAVRVREVAPAAGYERRESFYRAATRAPAGRPRRALKLAEHVPEMLRYRRAARAADVVHFQWLAVQQLDGHLLPRGRPLVLTAHDVLPREPARGQLAAQRRLYRRMDAVVAHSRARPPAPDGRARRRARRACT